MKRLIALMLCLALAMGLVLALAEPTADEEKLLEDYARDLDKTDRSFTLPIGIGIIYSVILRHDSVGIVLSPARSLGTALSVEALAYLTDLKEIRVLMKGGETVKLPATVEIEKYKVGTFVTLNLSMQTGSLLTQVIGKGAQIDCVTFVQNSGKEYDMTLDELNSSLSEAFGSGVDIVGQASEALKTFWANLTEGIGVFASDAYASIEKALEDVGNYMSGAASSIGGAIADAWNAAGEAVSGALDAAGSAIDDAANAAGSAIEDAAGAVTDLWNSLWGN